MGRMTVQKAFQLTGVSPALLKVASAETQTGFSTRESTFATFVKTFVEAPNSPSMLACHKYASFWGISEDCAIAQKKLAEWRPPTPEAEAEESYIIREEFNGKPVRKYAAFDQASTSAAAQAFYESRANYPLAWRKMAAARLIKKAEEHSVTLPAFIETYLYKAAGLGYPTADSINSMILDRYSASTKNSTHRELFDKLAAALSLLSEPENRTNMGLVKQAIAALEDYDVECDLTPRYESGVAMPEELIADSMTLSKLASCRDDVADSAVTLVNGTTVNPAAVPAQVLDAVYPGLGSAPLQKVARTLRAIPRNEANLLVRLLEEVA